MDYTRYCSLTYNGRLIDQELEGYVTINVEGRGILSRVLSTIDVPGRDGSVVVEQKLPPRILNVHFLMKARNSYAFLRRLTRLHDLLRTEDDVIVHFGDEPYYRLGRLTEANNPPYDSLQGVGSFTIFCQDPYKFRDLDPITGTNITMPELSVYPYRIRSITATIETSITGLQITNATTGRKIILTGDFLAGQPLQILPEESRILLNGQNIMDRLDFIHSDWKKFEICAGDTITAPQEVTLNLSERAL